MRVEVLGRALDGVGVDAVLHGGREEARHDRRADDAVAPGDGHALLVEAGFELVVIVGPVHVVLDVFLAAPDDLDRIFRLLGDERRLGDEVHLQPAAEAAAEKVIVDRDLLLLEAEHLGHDHLRHAGDLTSNPDIAAVRLDVRRAVDGLHGGMGEEGRLIRRFDLGRGFGESSGCVAFGLGDGAGFLGGLGERSDDIGRRDSLAWGPSLNLTLAASRPWRAAQ